MERFGLRSWMIAAIACIAAGACAKQPSGTEQGVAVVVGVPEDVVQASQGSIGLTFHRNTLTRELLVAMSTDGRPTPRIVESWRSSPDGLTWWLTIAPGVRFHDGVPLTARNIAPHLLRQLNGLSLGEIRSVEAESELELRITLREPYAFFLEDLSVISAVRTEEGQTIATGPYEVVAEAPDRVSLKAAQNYYRGKPEVDRIDVRLFPDQRNAWSALMRDEIDLLYQVSGEALEFVRGESSINVATFTRQYVYLLGFNVAHPVLADPRVRQAFDRGIDRAELVESGLSGEGEPAQGHVWPRHWAYDAAAGAIDYDPVGAARLLNAAGLPLRHEAGKMPARLRLHCIVYEPLKEVALVLQRQLANLDIDLQLEVLPTAELIDRLTKGQYESFIFEMTASRGLKFPYQFWHSSTQLLKHGYEGADDVLDRVRHAADDAAFRAAASAFQRRLHEDPPAVFLAWGRTSRAVSNRFEIPAGDDDIYHTIARWKPVMKAAN